MSKATTVTVEPKGLSDEDKKNLTKLLGPAQAGDKKALDELRPLIERAQLWPFIGDLARRVEVVWLDAMTGRNKLVREAFEHGAAELRRDLLATGDSPLERVLVDRVVACWLQVSHADMMYANLLNGDGHSFREGSHCQDRQESAQARFLRATRALATVRRLLIPAVQINVAEKQIIAQHSGQPRDRLDD